MITIRLFSKNKRKYSVHELNLLKEIFEDAFRTIVSEVCSTDPVIRCSNCEYKNICLDFAEAVHYLNALKNSN